MRGDHPDAIPKQVRPSGYRPGMVRASHRMRTDVPLEGDVAFPQTMQHAGLDRSNIGHCGSRVGAQGVTNDIRNPRWWDGNHNQTHVCRTGGIDDPSPKAGCDPGVADLVIAEVDAVTGGSQGATDRSTDQTGPDHDSDRGPGHLVGNGSMW